MSDVVDMRCPRCESGFVLKDCLVEGYNTVARCPGCGQNIYVGYA